MTESAPVGTVTQTVATTTTYLLACTNSEIHKQEDMCGGGSGPMPVFSFEAPGTTREDKIHHEATIKCYNLHFLYFPEACKSNSTHFCTNSYLHTDERPYPIDRPGHNRYPSLNRRIACSANAKCRKAPVHPRMEKEFCF